jgi:hypothetical protein
MPSTRSTKARDRYSPTYAVTKKRRPIQTRHQPKGGQNNGDNAIPSNVVTRQTSQRRATAITPTVNRNEDSSPSLPISPSSGKQDKQPNNRRRTEAKTANKVRGQKQVPARDPLPDRQGRNIHPAGQPTARRTPQEVAAEREAQKMALEEKIREGQRAKQLFALMSLAEEKMDEEMPTRNPQRLSAAICKRRQDCLDENSDEDEEFDFREIDEAISESSESDDSVAEPVQNNKVSSDVSYML